MVVRREVRWVHRISCCRSHAEVAGSGRARLQGVNGYDGVERRFPRCDTPLSSTVRPTRRDQRTRGGGLAAQVLSSIHLVDIGAICKLQINTRSRRPRDVDGE